MIECIDAGIWLDSEIIKIFTHLVYPMISASGVALTLTLQANVQLLHDTASVFLIMLYKMTSRVTSLKFLLQYWWDY